MEKTYRKNREILSARVLLIAADGDKPIETDFASALRMAESSDLDLVEIAPNQTPPVCKLMDFGAFRYRESKKSQESVRRSKSLDIKELRFRPATGEADLLTKARQASEFLEKGHPVKALVRFRGREMAHPELGFSLISRFSELISAQGAIEAPPRLDGRQIQASFSPKTARR